MAVGEEARRHHYVPEFYLRRWTIDGLVKTVDVDSRRAKRPLAPKSIAFERDLYTVPHHAMDDAPSRWVETYLSRVENEAAKRVGRLVEGELGPVVDVGLKADLAVFLGLQIGRTAAARRRSLIIAEAPDVVKLSLLTRMAPHATSTQIEHSVQDQLVDSTAGAIRMLIEQVKNVNASTLFKRNWAVYEPSGPLVTSDEPVVLIAGPPFARDGNAGTALSGVIVYPLSPKRALVMLRSDLWHRSPFSLTRGETRRLNREIVANAAKSAFERPSDEIIESSEVPCRRPTAEPEYSTLTVDDAIDLMRRLATQKSRWTGIESPPTWPVLRWHR